VKEHHDYACTVEREVKIFSEPSIAICGLEARRVTNKVVYIFVCDITESGFIPSSSDQPQANQIWWDEE